MHVREGGATVYPAGCKTQLRVNDLNPKLPQLARVRAAQGKLPNHGMTGPARTGRLDLHVHDSRSWTRVIEVAMRILIRHADDCTKREAFVPLAVEATRADPEAGGRGCRPVC